jgi:VanZ family protein
MHTVTRHPRTAVARWSAVLAWMALIFALSSVSEPGVPSGWTMPGHAALYAVLGALAAEALRADRDATRVLALAVLLSSLYGMSDEIHQAFVPGRMPELVDWAVDTLGATVGAGALLWARSTAARRLRRG